MTFKHMITKTRIPDIAGFIIALACIGGIYVQLSKLNPQANQYWHQKYQYRTERISHDHHEEFRLKLDLNTLSDEHSVYLMRIARYKSIPGIKKLHKDNRYMHMSSQLNKIDSRDTNEIDNYRSDVGYDRTLRHHYHSRGITNNILSNRDTPVFHKMVEFFITDMVLVVATLYFFCKVCFFKHIRADHIQKAKELAEDNRHEQDRKRYEAEYGDDEGFDDNSDDDSSDADSNDESKHDK